MAFPYTIFVEKFLNLQLKENKYEKECINHL